MSVYEVVNGIADVSTKVSIWRRDGYALCKVAGSDVSTLLCDYSPCVLLWNRKVVDTEIRDGGHEIRLVIE